MIKLLIFSTCLFLIFARSICCENCRGGNVLESEVLGAEHCANRLICTVDCNCLGRAIYYDVTNTYPDSYYVACTLPKRNQVEKYIQTIQVHEIETAIKQDFSDKRYIPNYKKFSAKLPHYLQVFARSISRICERGEISSKTPIDVLMILWRNYRVNDKDFIALKDNTIIVNIVKEIFSNVINVYSERCPCSKIVPAPEYHAQTAIHRHNCHIACQKKLVLHPNQFAFLRSRENRKRRNRFEPIVPNKHPGAHFLKQRGNYRGRR